MRTDAVKEGQERTYILKVIKIIVFILTMDNERPINFDEGCEGETTAEREERSGVRE